MDEEKIVATCEVEEKAEYQKPALSELGTIKTLTGSPAGMPDW